MHLIKSEQSNCTINSIEKDPEDEPLDPSLHLTDGFCLLKNSRVVLNHYDIDYYDYSAHLIYLKSPDAFEEKFKESGPAAVYADNTRIYDLSFVSHVSSFIPPGPVVWFPSVFYPDYVVCVDIFWVYKEEPGWEGDPREDPRIVEALKKYGQFRHGLQCEISSFRYDSPDHVVLELELRNEDPVNYYYYDPEKLGMERYHYVTNGLILRTSGDAYSHQVQPKSWEGYDPDRMSLLESGDTVILTLTYDQFDLVPPGSYSAYFEFPGPHFVEDREDLEWPNGRIWLGDLQLHDEVVISPDLF